MRVRLHFILALFAATSLVACAGTNRRTLPQAELDALDLVPSDAFFAGRVDGTALRDTPTWSLLGAGLPARMGDQNARLINGTDHLYVAIGGLVAVPMATEETSESRAWRDTARLFAGRLPKVVGILEGDAASVCRTLLTEVQTQEAGGYTYGSQNGVTLAMRGERLCAITFEPLFLELVADQGAPSPVLGRLASVAPNGELGLASMAIELDSPAFLALVEGAGPAEPDEDDARILRLSKRIYAILASGVDAAEWQVTRTENGYASRTRVQLSDRDRGTMWREITEIYLDILRAVVESNIAGDEVTPHLNALSENTRIEALEDGYSVVTGMSDAHIAELVAAMMPGESMHTYDGDADVAVSVSRVPVMGTARETIDAIAPNIETLLTDSQRSDAVTELSHAYASVGRFDDAFALLTRAIGMTDGQERGAYADELCELQLASGHAAEALATATAELEVCDQSYCGESRAWLTSCRYGARAKNGEANVLEELDDAGQSAFVNDDPKYFGITRARLLIVAGRHLEAVATIRTVCPGSGTAEPCASLSFLAVESLARSDAPLATVLAAIERARANDYGEASARVREEAHARTLWIECLARSLREPSATTARDACRTAVAAEEELHGALHPETGAAALAYARVLTASRDAAGATRELAKVDAVLAALGPATPLRADRATVGARPRR